MPPQQGSVQRAGRPGARHPLPGRDLSRRMDERIETQQQQQRCRHRQQEGKEEKTGGQHGQHRPTVSESKKK